MTISLVCCSYNRAAALRATMANKLSVRSVDEVLVVLDGSTDDSAQFLESCQLQDSRLRVVVLPHQGIQATRNAAISVAAGDWLLMVDDDDFLSEDYADVLMNAASRTGAVLAGAPWIHVSDPDELGDALAALRRDAQARITLNSHPSTFTVVDVETPFLVSAVLIRADVARQFSFDSGYRGIAWREETDFFLRIMGAGHAVVRSCHTYSWMARRYGGGHPRSRLVQEYWIARNELRFLFLRSRELKSAQPSWKGWAFEYLAFVAARWSGLISRTLARPFRKLRG